MERYLRKCLSSLLISCGLDRVEVIVVNDGSKDCSLEIARDYEQKYPKVFKVIDKENGNYGSCINVGLKIANGKYVKILDADDSFVTLNFEVLVDTLLNIDVDIVFTDFVKNYGLGEAIVYSFDLPVRSIIPIEQVAHSRAFLDIQMHAITYRTALLQAMNYHQTEGISYTDLEWCFSPITQVRTVYYLNIPIYQYMLGRVGQTMDLNVMRQRISHTMTSFSSMLHSIRDIKIPSYLDQFIFTRLYLRANYIYDFYLLSNISVDRTPLLLFDKELFRLNPKVYEACGKRYYRLHVPYLYIANWRKGKQRIPIVIKILGRFFDVIASFRSMIQKNR